ncbi:MAG: hypothetical protein EA412_10650 [Chitinophagaceae bacterium]|nr:MAG: hypothetical protein EA412_10650 [Chitinophagaceae bacterium]
MNKFIVLFIFFLMGYYCLKADNIFQNYQPIESSGFIPEHLITRSSERYRQRLEEIDAEDRRSRRAEARFALSSSFVVDRLLRNGQLLFNDTLTSYVNRVTDIVLQDNPDLREEITVYVVKNPTVNAFASGDGFVLICMGLLAQVENEAQLAFIIGHEITHYKKEHSMNRFKKVEGVNRGRGVLRNPGNQNNLLDIHAFSRDMEMEADEIGLDFLRNTDYDLWEAEKVFDVLHYSYLPFNEKVFDPSFIVSGASNIPNTFLTDELNEIRVDREAYDDTESTHPSTAQRKSLIIRLIERMERENGTNARKPFILPEEDFRYIQNIARFEQTYAYTKQGDYMKALYNVYLLEDEFPDNLFLNRIKAECLYTISKFINRNKARDVLPRHNRIEGQSHQMYYMLNQMRDEDINIFALANIYESHLKFPDEKLFKLYSEELMEDLFVYHDISAGSFSTEAPEIKAEEEKETEVEEEQEEDRSKYERIRRLRSERISEGEDSYNRYAFTDIYSKDPDFFLKLERAYLLSKEIEKEAIDGEKDESRLVENKSSGVKKIVELDPMYFRIDARRSLQMDYLGAEQRESFIEREVNSIARSLNVEVNHLRTTNLDKDDVDKFNDIAFLKSWYGARIANSTEVPILSADIDRIDGLIETYGTQYFSWRGLITLRERHQINSALLLSGCLLPPLLPYALVETISPSISSLYFNIVFDIKSGDVAHLYVTEFGYSDSNVFLKSKIYDNIYLMSRN